VGKLIRPQAVASVVSVEVIFIKPIDDVDQKIVRVVLIVIFKKLNCFS
jgi:hypothetical protein